MTKKTEVATTEVKGFELQTISGELKEAFQEEMNGLGKMSFDRIKIPSGGGLSFEIPGESEDDVTSATEINAVIVDHYPTNAYWKDPFTGGNQAPDCSSLDGKTGIELESKQKILCENCPHNQFKEDGSGKDCKNLHRLMLLMEGNPLPVMLTLPPTSLRTLKDYIFKSVLTKGLRSWDIVTKITLKKDKSIGGITYSKAVFTRSDMVLTPEQQKAAEAMHDLTQGMRALTPIETDESEAQQSQTADGFINVPTEGEENMPF